MLELFVDANRCIGCRACEEACSECPGHGGVAMIHLDYVARADSVQTAPTVCMHCEEPSCVAVCPVDCFYEDDTQLYIHPDECIDCAACEPECPVDAIFVEDEVPEKWKHYIEKNAALREHPLAPAMTKEEATQQPASPPPS